MEQEHKLDFLPADYAQSSGVHMRKTNEHT